jgi:hypothetical protein
MPDAPTLFNLLQFMSFCFLVTACSTAYLIGHQQGQKDRRRKSVKAVDVTKIWKAGK